MQIVFFAWPFLSNTIFLNKINVVSCEGAVSSAAARTTVDPPSNQLEDKAYVPGIAGKLAD